MRKSIPSTVLTKLTLRSKLLDSHLTSFSEACQDLGNECNSQAHFIGSFVFTSTERRACGAFFGAINLHQILCLTLSGSYRCQESSHIVELQEIKTPQQIPFAVRMRVRKPTPVRSALLLPTNAYSQSASQPASQAHIGAR